MPHHKKPAKTARNTLQIAMTNSPTRMSQTNLCSHAALVPCQVSTYSFPSILSWLVICNSTDAAGDLACAGKLVPCFPGFVFSALSLGVLGSDRLKNFDKASPDEHSLPIVASTA